MKKVFVLVVLFLAVLSTNIQAQAERSVFVNFGSVANAVTETKYVNLEGWSVIDSVTVGLLAKNETEIDSVDLYVGAVEPGADAEDGGYSATAYTYTTTFDCAASSSLFEALAVDNATKLPGTILRGVNALKIVTRGDASGGCDATKNNVWVVLQIWGTPEK